MWGNYLNSMGKKIKLRGEKRWTGMATWIAEERENIRKVEGKDLVTWGKDLDRVGKDLVRREKSWIVGEKTWIVGENTWKRKERLG